MTLMKSTKKLSTLLLIAGITTASTLTGCYALTDDNTPDLQIRFGAKDKIYSSLSRPTGRGYIGTVPFKDLAIQNFSVANTGDTNYQVQKITLNAYAGETHLQSQSVDLVDASNMLGLVKKYYSLNLPIVIDGIFNGSRIVKKGESISTDLDLSAKEAIILTDNYFVIKGTADRLMIEVTATDDTGKTVTVDQSITVNNEGAKNDYIFPAESANWYVYSNIDPNGHHRFTQNTEFHFDATLLGPDGKLYKGDGMKWEDWYGYNKKILAAADGVVVKSSDGADFPLQPLMRKEGETWPAYMGRIGKRQMGLFFNPEIDPLETGGGNHIIIKHANGEYSWYLHLAKDSLKVKVGQKVTQGKHIAGMGGTGENPNVHLHFGLTDGPDFISQGIPFKLKDVVDPLKVLNTSRPIDAGRFYWLDRDGLEKAN